MTQNVILHNNNNVVSAHCEQGQFFSMDATVFSIATNNASKLPQKDFCHAKKSGCLP